MGVAASQRRTVQYLKKGVGRLMVPCGNYGDQATYTCTASVAPLVYYKASGASTGYYYVMVQNVTWTYGTDADPQTDYVSNSPAGNNTWERLQTVTYLFTQLLMADFGKIASAVFYEHLMFSQQGTIDGVDSPNYENLVTQSNGDVRENSGDFIPNIWMNFANGRAEFNNVNVKGTIRATKLYRSIQTLSVYTNGSVYIDADAGEIIAVVGANNSEVVQQCSAYVYLPLPANAAGQILEITAETVGAYGGLLTVYLRPRSGVIKGIANTGTSYASIALSSSLLRVYSDGTYWYKLP